MFFVCITYSKMKELQPSTIFFNLCGGTLGTAATTGLLYQPRMIGEGDCGEIGGMKIVQGKPKYSEKTLPHRHFVLHKISHD
jgi:hypothetical protein